jgi:hypothetical protein
MLSKSTNWQPFINKTIGNNINNLHKLSKNRYIKKFVGRSLSLGTGAGNDVVDLLISKWEVTGIDIESICEQVVLDQLKGTHTGVFLFQNTSLVNMELSGKYDYVSAFNVLPFINKNELPSIINNISIHMCKSGIFAFNMFGKNHSFIKTNSVYSITEVSIKTLLFDFNISHKKRVQYIKKDGTHWDTINIIAIKK